MRRVNGRSSAALTLLGILLGAEPLSAQTPPREAPPNPYRTLFGANDTRVLSLHALDLVVSLDGGLDDGMHSVAPVDGGTPDARLQEVYDAGLSLGYTRQGRRVRGALTGSTMLPYYSIFEDEPLTLAYGADGNISVGSRDTTWSASGSFFHSPYYVAALDPSAGPGVGNGSYGRTSALNPNNVSDAGAGVTHKLGRRTSLSATYRFDSTHFTDDLRWNRNQNARGMVERQVSRLVRLTGNYEYHTGDYRYGDLFNETATQDVTAGFVYSSRGPRGLSTNIRAAVGSSFVREFGRKYQGWRWGFHFDRSLTTRWTLRADYDRKLRYYGTLLQPVWTDEVGAAFNGFVNARTKLMFEARYTNGWRVSEVGDAFDMYWARAGVEWALTQWAAVAPEYVYYRYYYPPGYVLPAGMPRQLDRQRVQIGARFWVPLARGGSAGGRARVPNGQ
jgi:hypothetical protein